MLCHEQHEWNALRLSKERFTQLVYLIKNASVATMKIPLTKWNAIDIE